MSGYTRNSVYDYIRNAIVAAHPTVFCTSRKVAKPSYFPSCYIHEIERERLPQYTQLDFQDVQWESAFEVQIVSNKATTASTEAYNIMETARAAFNELYYREFSETNIDGGDNFTVIGRFRRVIGGGDSMPTTT